jgi:hypothetical protein
MMLVTVPLKPAPMITGPDTFDSSRELAVIWQEG